MHRLRLLVAGVLGCALLVGVPALVTAPAAHAAGRAISASPAKPIANEFFAVKGKASSRGRRPVVLQKKQGKRWRTVSRTRTAPTGAFTFKKVRTRTAATYRAVAPAARVNGKKLRKYQSRPRTVRPVAQKAAVTALPQIAQQGATAASATGAKYVVEGRFTPARSGRAAVLQRKQGARWVKAGTGRQNSAGAVAIAAPGAGTYRVVASAAQGAAQVATGASSTTGWTTPAFADEFGGTALGSAWSHRGQDWNAEGKRNCSRGSEDTVDVASGTLRLQVKKDLLSQKLPRACPEGTYRNGHIGTPGQFSFTHGVAAARVKFPKGQGQHGAFWLQPNGGLIPGNTKTGGAEIDVVEYFGHGRRDGGLSSFVHYLDANRKDVKVGGVWPEAERLKAATDEWWKSYHVFSVHWTPTYYSFRIDGQELFRTAKGVSGTDQYLILSLLSSDYELSKLTAKSLPSTMYVDWVRVWEQ